jgi:hypothetical protein
MFPKVEHKIEKVFTVAGVDYYSFANLQDAACLRALKTMTFYTELQMRCDYDYLKAHVAAVDEVLMSGRIDIYKLKTYNDYLKDRLTWIVDTDLVYKLASVVYFDETENPLDYDFTYCQKKIEFWKKHLPVNDFFYAAPILELIPFLKNADVNLQEYLTVTKKVKALQLANISGK